MPNTVGTSITLTYQNVKDFVDRHETSTPDETVKASFQRTTGVSLAYVVYRWLQGLLHLTIYFASFFDFKRTWTPAFTAANRVHRGPKFYAKWFLYLTHWGVFFNMIQGLLGAFIVLKAYSNRRNQTTNTIYGVSLKVAKFYRYLFGVCLNLGVWIAVGFWTLIYEPVFFSIDIVTVSQHGLGCLFLLLDLFVVKFPYKLFTGVWTLLVCTAYEHLLIGHYLLGALDRYDDKPYVYEVTNFNENAFGATLVTASAMMTVISFHFLLWGLYLLKRNFVEVLNTNSR